MRASGLVIIGYGLAVLTLPIAFIVWAHHMFTVGPFVFKAVLIGALPGAIIVGAGATLVWVAARRRRLEVSPAPD